MTHSEVVILVAQQQLSSWRALVLVSDVKRYLYVSPIHYPLPHIQIDILFLDGAADLDLFRGALLFLSSVEAFKLVLLPVFSHLLQHLF